MFRYGGLRFLAALSVVLVGVGIALAEYGTNWTAQYFNNTSLSGDPVVTLTGINGLNFSWGSGSPAPGVNPDQFSARFSSVQNFAGGAYEFVVTSDDGVRVLIDGQIVLDRFYARPLTTDRFTQVLTPGIHSLVVEYFEESDQASLDVQWFQTGAGGGGVIMPTPIYIAPTPVYIVPTPEPPVEPTVLPRPTMTPLPPIPEGAITATVIRARVLLVREMPYMGAPVVGRVLRGQTYAVLGRDADARWFLLQLSDRQAWAYGYYLFVNANEFNAPVVSAFITTGNPAAYTGVVAQTHQVLKLRALPTSESEQIGRIGWGDIIPIIGRNADDTWYQVIYKGTPGWVTAAYIRIVEGDINAVPVTG